MKRTGARGQEAGFTLIELLVALALMMILLSSVVAIFFSSTTTYSIQEGRIKIYDQAKTALRVIEEDLKGCITFSGGTQRFIMENGVIDQSAGTIAYGGGGGHDSSAGDKLIFRTTTKADKSLIQTVEVTYELYKPEFVDNQKTVERYDQNGSLVKSRPLFILRRTMTTANATTPLVYDQPVKDGKGNIIHEWRGTSSVELCSNVLSFNLEYIADNYVYSQLDPSPFPSSDPLGDGQGKNDPPSNTAYRVPKVRITIIITDGPGALQERVFSKDISIPVG